MTIFVSPTRSVPRVAPLTDRPWGALALLRHWREMLSRAGRAQARRRAVERLPSEEPRDSGLSPEDAAGARLWQEDLPFFMQSGFGRGRPDGP
jgi:hypothetical protein